MAEYKKGLVEYEKKRDEFERRQIDALRYFDVEADNRYSQDKGRPLRYFNTETIPKLSYHSIYLKDIERKFIKFANKMLDFNLCTDEFSYMENMTLRDNIQDEWNNFSLEEKMNIYNRSIIINPIDWSFLDIGSLGHLMDLMDL